MQWDEDAVLALNRIPEFVKEKAKAKIEERAISKGRDRVMLEDVNEVYKARFGEDDGSKKIAIVRCDIVSEVCPGVGCLDAFGRRREQFKEYGPDTKLIGFFTCGGCSGRRVFRLANTLKKYKVDAIHMSSCMLMEAPFARCPNKEEIKKSITRLGIDVIEGTHHEVGQYVGGVPFHKK